MQSRTATATLLLCTLLLSSMASLAGEPSLDAHRRAHEESVHALRTERDAKARELREVYGRSLGTLIEFLKKAGDPDPVITMAAEQRRFAREGTVPASDPAGLPPALLRLRASYRKAVVANDASSDRRVTAATAKYLGILERLMQKLTAEGKLDLALNVKEERRRVEFILADAESRQHVPAKTTPVSGVRPPPGRRPGRSPSAVKRTINVTGSEITLGKWRQCLKVKAGTIVTVTAEALTGIEAVPYSEDAFRIREGKNGLEYVFDTKGLYVESYIRKDKKLTFRASEDEDLYIMPKQESRFRLSVILDPPR